ncbi:MAG: hypothetical protein HQL82_06485 [Magnetococcales bacterium]|nr:hypothetical protein [Magnetococcales bacterium]
MKPRVAFFDFAGCEGCQLAVLNCEEVFLDLLEQVEIVEFREAMSETAHRIDIAFIEGSINREEDAQRLRDIRARSRILVALGACANMGNVQARANFTAPAEHFKRIYGSADRDRVQTDPRFWSLWAHTRVRAVHEIVAVDYRLRGCPMVAEEFLQLVKALISGAQPRQPANPVCVECRLHEFECAFDRGDTCLGQITWGGCAAVCIGQGYRCDGCRGLLPQANLAAHRQLLSERGLSDTDIRNRYRLFGSGEALGEEQRP